MGRSLLMVLYKFLFLLTPMSLVLDSKRRIVLRPSNFFLPQTQKRFAPVEKIPLEMESALISAILKSVNLIKGIVRPLMTTAIFLIAADANRAFSKMGTVMRNAIILSATLIKLTAW